MSTCSKCGSHIFRVQRNEPSESQFVVYFVQCSSCGTPVGVLEYANSAALLEGLETKLDQLTNNVEQISYDLSNLQSELRRR